MKNKKDITPQFFNVSKWREKFNQQKWAENLF